MPGKPPQGGARSPGGVLVGSGGAEGAAASVCGAERRRGGRTLAARVDDLTVLVAAQQWRRKHRLRASLNMKINSD